jgi:hypothetical protein
VQRLAADEFHRQPTAALGAVAQFAQVMHRRDGGVRQAGRDLRLGHEALGVAARQQNLDRHLTIELQVKRRIHDPHAALGNDAGDDVPRNRRGVGQRFG